MSEKIKQLYVNNSEKNKEKIKRTRKWLNSQS